MKVTKDYMLYMKYFLIILVVFASCSSVKKLDTSHHTVLLYEGPWKSNFKDEVFRTILSEMYGDSFRSCCLSADASSSANADWLNYDTTVFSNIKRVSKSFMENKFIKGNIEGLPVKMNFALQFRLSHQLDSLTGVYYRHFQRDSMANSRMVDEN